MKRLLILVLAFYLCSPTCHAEERTTTLILKDGSEVSGESLPSGNGIHRIKTSSGIVEVNSNDIKEFQEEVLFSWEDLGINKDNMDKAIENQNDYSDNQDEPQEEIEFQNVAYVDESDSSNYQDDSYEEESNDSYYQDDSYEEEYNDSVYLNEE